MLGLTWNMFIGLLVACCLMIFPVRILHCWNHWNCRMSRISAFAASYSCASNMYVDFIISISILTSLIQSEVITTHFAIVDIKMQLHIPNSRRLAALPVFIAFKVWNVFDPNPLSVSLEPSLFHLIFHLIFVRDCFRMASRNFSFLSTLCNS